MQPVWLVTRRPAVTASLQLDTTDARVETVPGLLDLLRRTGSPALIAVDDADHDLVLADAALKIQLRFADSLLVVLQEQHRGPGSRDYAGVDEVVAPESEWRPAVVRMLQELRHLTTLGWTGKSDGLRQLAGQVRQAAGADIAVLVSGESGTGKELVARGLHALSGRAAGPFVAVNTGAIPETLLESELFGHEKGAFTGASARRLGIFESAQGGTVFLDEIGDMPAITQVKLLRVLESGAVRRVGSTEELHVDVRVVSATHRDLLSLEESGAFRRDLYYRLSAITLRAAPLRERRGDILPLLFSFWKAGRSGADTPGELTADAVRLLWNYAWPGNVRELRNFADASAVALGSGRLAEEHVLQYVQRERGEASHLPVPAGPHVTAGDQELLLRAVLHLGQEMHQLRELIERRLPDPAAQEPAVFRPQTATVADAERRAIESALIDTGGNRREAARKLGIGERTLYRKIRDYGLK